MAVMHSKIDDLVVSPEDVIELVAEGSRP